MLICFILISVNFSCLIFLFFISFIVQVQEYVKRSKSAFDRQKLDCLQKVDLLAAARCNMFSRALILYQSTLLKFTEKSVDKFIVVAKGFKGNSVFITVYHYWVTINLKEAFWCVLFCLNSFIAKKLTELTWILCVRSPWTD